MMFWNKKKRIFLDYASATPMLPEAKKAMEKYLGEDFYNPSAIYGEAVSVKKEMEAFRARAAKLVGAQAKGVVFTSGGTESDNLAILGAFEAFLENQKTLKQAQAKPHIVVSAIEHPAVMAAADEVVRRGGEKSILPVDAAGMVSAEELKKLLKKNTFLVSVGLVNGEIGAIEPLARLGRVVREARKANGGEYPHLHSDASQAPNFVDIDLENLQADMLTIDGAKIGGPKGIGALIFRKGAAIRPLTHGGPQEGGLRAGTQSPALIAGFVTALEHAVRDREKEAKRLESYRKYFSDYVAKKLPKAVVNGHPKSHSPNILSISVPGVLAEFLLLKLDAEGVMASVGAACSYDEKVSGSPVIRALGRPELAESTIRFSFGRETTPDDIRRAAEIFCREASNMVQ